MASLDMTCERCAVAQKCPKAGASPLIVKAKRYLCRIVGGFGRTPVDQTILSADSQKASAESGPCLTLAEVPELDDGIVDWKLTKVFHHPVLSNREQPTAILYGQLNLKNPAD